MCVHNSQKTRMAAAEFVLQNCKPRWKRSEASRESIREFLHCYSGVNDLRYKLCNTATVYDAWCDYVTNPGTHQVSRRSPAPVRAVLEALGYDYAVTDYHRARRRIRKSVHVTNSLYSITDSISDFVTCILQWSNRVATAALVTGLGHFGAAIGNSTEKFAAMDGAKITHLVRELARKHKWNSSITTAVRATVWRARSHKDVDITNRFQTHTQHVTSEFMAQFPVLYQFPVRLSRRLASLHDKEDTAFLVQFAQDVARERVCTMPGRRVDRAYNSVGAQFSALVYQCQCIKRQEETYRDHLLCRSLTLTELANVTGRLVAHQYHLQATHQYSVGQPMVTILGFMRTCIRSGVFSPSIECNCLLSKRMVQMAMFKHEEKDPAMYKAMQEGVHCQRPGKPPRSIITDKDVADMRRAASTLTVREEAILELLVTTGLRAGAIQGMRIVDVWDGEQQCVRPSIGVLEKNSDVRYIFPSDHLKEMLTQQVRTQNDSSLLFPSPRTPGKASVCCVRVALKRICHAASVGPFTPHQFRAFIVNSVMRGGGRLDEVARFIGHRSTSVTWKHYWTDPTFASNVASTINSPKSNKSKSGNGDTLLQQIGILVP